MTRQLIFFERNRKLLLLIFKLEFVGPTRIAEWRNGARETKNKTGAKRREEKIRIWTTKKFFSSSPRSSWKCVRCRENLFLFLFRTRNRRNQFCGNFVRKKKTLNNNWNENRNVVVVVALTPSSVAKLIKSETTFYLDDKNFNLLPFIRGSSNYRPYLSWQMHLTR